MKRAITGSILGAIIGAVIFSPPVIPAYFALSLNLDVENIVKYSIDLLAILFSAIGFATGAALGGVIGWKNISLAPFKSKPYSIFFWCTALFSLLGLEAGFIFSPVSLIGLGNIPSAGELLSFSFLVGCIGTVLGGIIGVIVVAVYLEINR